MAFNVDRRSDGGTVVGLMAKKSATDKLHPDRKIVASNRRARHDYDILETFEAGIALVGGEVKAMRAGQVQLKDSYARVDRGQAWLLGVHVAPYVYSNGFGSYEPERPRKLLLHRREIDELAGRSQQEALTIIPLSIYFKEGRAKVELGLARGRKSYDKRHVIAARDAARDAEREMGRRR